MLELPITNVRLQACSEAWARMTPTEQGRYCARCNRQVIDFTHASQDAVAQARATAADGRLCGRFRVKQLAPESRPTRLQPKLRLFLAALVLVCVEGLSAQQAWAQVQKPTPKAAAPRPAWEETAVGIVAAPTGPQPEQAYVHVDQMPEFRGGQKNFVQFFANNIRYPEIATKDGKVFITFTVLASGKVANAKVLKGLEPVLDAEALRVVRLMPPWIPGKLKGKPVAVSYTVPISFLPRPAAQPSKGQ